MRNGYQVKLSMIECNLITDCVDFLGGDDPRVKKLQNIIWKLEQPIKRAASWDYPMAPAEAYDEIYNWNSKRIKEVLAVLEAGQVHNSDGEARLKNLIDKLKRITR